MLPPYLRSPELLEPESSLVLLCDLQDRFMPIISQSEKLAADLLILLESARDLEIPIIGTEQYPEKLGSTIADLQPFLSQAPAKKRFSCVEALQLPAVGEREDQRRQVILVGIETHVCILQTAFDLQAIGYEVVLPSDLIASRYRTDHDSALLRMLNSGMTITSLESLLFEWLATAEHPLFKAISSRIKSRQR